MLGFVSGSRATHRVPILMYHRVTTRTGSHPLSLAAVRFRGQLALLHALGYRSVSPVEVAAGAALPPRRVAITLDDGYVDTLTVALPILRQFGFTATCYIVTGAVGGVSHWTDPTPLMDWSALRAWLQAGMEVGAHTVSHRDLTTLGDAEVREEVFASKARLEDRLGIAVASFAYPFNHAGRRALEAVRDAGYAAGCAGPEVARSPHALTRVNTAHESWVKFALQLLPAYPALRQVYRSVIPKAEPGRSRSSPSPGGGRGSRDQPGVSTSGFRARHPVSRGRSR